MKKYDLTEYTVKSNKISDNKKIVQLSDLHNDKYPYLRDLLMKIKPDYIFITGDLINKRRPNIKQAISIIETIKDISPIYFISGNHELYIDAKLYKQLKEGLKKSGVNILENEAIELESMYLIGLDDVNITQGDKIEYLNHYLKSLVNGDKFKVLLSHKPHYFKTYSKYDIDLVLTGHAHGGQVRIFNQGLYAPGQGVLPKYTSGMFCDNGTTMIVSRGMGNSLCHIRINNRSEIVVINIQKLYSNY